MNIHRQTVKLFAMGALLAVSVGQAKAQQANLLPSLAPTAPIGTALQPVNTGHIRTSQVLGIPTSYCGHVIDLLMTNRMRQSFGHAGNHAVQVYAPHLSVGLTPGDLELLCVQLISEGDSCNGPVFQISMKNNSQMPIGNFRISVVGVLGQIHMHSPTATIAVPRIEAGCELLVQVQLPVTCMLMGVPGQQVPFDTLIVAVDSFDELLECDELNNVQILTRADIPLLVVVSAAPPVAVESVPAQPAEPAPEAVVPQTPQENAPSPLDNIDLDDLVPDEADKAGLLVR
ncbi:MAG TPA: hypothetical protein EYG03_05890 [Planctomycetes bacterium]|nr:hypothetical protein [Fuerstiella sp.]HIK91503.1 hypothetical protein [Planctomycetota bacterium]